MQIIDIFATVRMLQSQRPAMLQNAVSYEINLTNYKHKIVSKDSKAILKQQNLPSGQAAIQSDFSCALYEPHVLVFSYIKIAYILTHILVFSVLHIADIEGTLLIFTP